MYWGYSQAEQASLVKGCLRKLEFVVKVFVVAVQFVLILAVKS